MLFKYQHFIIGNVFLGVLVLCKSRITINVPPNGTICSPGYPKAYSNNLDITWQIKSVSGGNIFLRIEDLDIEPAAANFCSDKSSLPIRPCCERNWLSLPSRGGEKHYCGSFVPQELKKIKTFSREVSIKLHISDVNKGGEGFCVSFGAEEPVDCLLPKMVPCGSVSDGCYNSSSQRCDGVVDCPGGQDEFNCQQLCASGRGHYPLSKKCDGHPDCSDYSDELDCGYCETPEEALCSMSPLSCFRPLTQLCDGRFNCPQGEDEVGCYPDCEGRIACSSGEGCYSTWQHCDFLSDCSDGSDEAQCPHPICSPLLDKQLCHNGRCLPSSVWCDGTDDCGDNSDEVACIKNSVVALSIMGCLLSGLLMVTAVSCAFRIYGQRLLSPSNYHLHISPRLSSHLRMTPSVPLPTLMDDEFFMREPPPAYSVVMNQQPEAPPPPPTRTRRSRRHRPRPVAPPQAAVIKPPDYETSSAQSSPSRGSDTSGSGTDDTFLLSS